MGVDNITIPAVCLKINIVTKKNCSYYFAWIRRVNVLNNEY